MSYKHETYCAETRVSAALMGGYGSTPPKPEGGTVMAVPGHFVDEGAYVCVWSASGDLIWRGAEVDDKQFTRLDDRRRALS